MNSRFQQELQDSLYLHRPLPLHREASLEAGFEKKKVTASRVLYSQTAAVAKPTAPQAGSLEERDGVITITAPLRSSCWPEGAAPDGDYSNFGTARVAFSFPAQSWQGYNRLRLQVRPRLRGGRIAHLNVSVQNRGEIPLPDPYFREGATVFDLENGVWNDCIWEFEAMPRDAITELNLYVFLSGHDVAAGQTLIYDYRAITLEKIDTPEHEHGWQRADDALILSTVGYWTGSRKTAIGGSADSFCLLDAGTGEAVYRAAARTVHNSRGDFRVLDFSEFDTPGLYRLRAGDAESCTFEISPSLGRESLWSVLNFIYCERCGTPVPGKHGTCHQDITAHHKGVTMSFGGGWHDAGDVSQQAAQTAEVVHALFEAASRCTEDRLLYLRLMEEAQWGLDFILRTRFGDGYRATSAGATRFTDNLIGNFDDVEARVHNHAYENFLFGGVEAFAARCLRGYDDALADNALAAAEEDYDFACQRFAETGVEPAIMFEHTYNSGLSQYYAVACWTASCLYAADSREDRAADARQWAEKLLLCQEQGAAGIAVKGFFYRDESHRAIVHFNHQSREYQFVQALDALCRTQPQARALSRWERAMELYGQYLKAISGNTAPYGMLPAGIHRLDEAGDAETFRWLHVGCDYNAEKANYQAQLAQGTPVAPGYVLRNFPVWFSFRGNSAVMLAMGKAAAIVGRYFQDRALLQLGQEQLYWMWGKNPFGQSLVYGVGSSYCRQYAVLCGECVGEVPVGIETRDNEDVPYWPQNNNATFREVWIGAACRWLWLYNEYLESAQYQIQPTGSDE
ncbi:MAG: glycoside hydrolase family 9 protein [Eubacteriales bacterium]|nr:glycoside hydrolase family 9 protein [Eubacteriales bacterium]